MSTPPGNAPWTVLRLVNWTREFLERHQVDQPRLSAEVLLAHVLGCPRLALYTQFERVPPPEALATYRELVKRAAAREPVAYLVGHREFYSLDLLVTPDVLIPRPETELLAEQAIDFLRPLPAPRYWDACTGSGAVAVAVAKHVPSAAILASDISEPALAVARRNAEKHALAPRITLARADLLNLPPELGDRAPFDAVTVNPPYISDAQMAELPPEVRHEPALALRGGSDGLDAVRAVLAQALEVLRPGGRLGVEIGFGQAEAVWGELRRLDRYDDARFLRDPAGIERVLVALRR